MKWNKLKENKKPNVEIVAKNEEVKKAAILYVYLDMNKKCHQQLYGCHFFFFLNF